MYYIYAISCDFSRTRTEQELVSRFSGTSQQGSGMFLDLQAKIKKLVSQTLDKYKNPVLLHNFRGYENSIYPRTLYVEHSIKKQTAITQLSMLETRIASMCPSCITHRQKLTNITKRLQILSVQVNQTKMKRLNEKIRRTMCPSSWTLVSESITRRD